MGVEPSSASCPSSARASSLSLAPPLLLWPHLLVHFLPDMVQGESPAWTGEVLGPGGGGQPMCPKSGGGPSLPQGWELAHRGSPGWLVGGEPDGEWWWASCCPSRDA